MENPSYTTIRVMRDSINALAAQRHMLLGAYRVLAEYVDELRFAPDSAAEVQRAAYAREAFTVINAIERDWIR